VVLVIHVGTIPVIVSGSSSTCWNYSSDSQWFQ